MKRRLRRRVRGVDAFCLQFTRPAQPDDRVKVVPDPVSMGWGVKKHLGAPWIVAYWYPCWGTADEAQEAARTAGFGGAWVQR